MSSTTTQHKSMEEKPQYGPLMSPPIFAELWLHKFNLFYILRYATKNTGTALAWMLNLCEQGHDVLLNFHIQAKQHSFIQNDFPEEQPSLGNGILLQRSSVNPFVQAKALSNLIEGFLGRLRLWKEGVRVSGLAWQAMLYSERQLVNEVLAKIDEAKEAGWWVADEEVVKKVTDKFLDKVTSS